MSARRMLTAAGVLAATGLLIAGCGGSGNSVMIDEAMSADMAMADQVASTDGSTVATVDRAVIRTAYVSIRVNSVPDAIDQVRELVTESTGVISSESLSSGSPGGYASITAQVPAADLTSFLDEVGTIGDVDTLDVTAQDVTTQVIDLDARIEVLEGSITRLTELLNQAQRIEDIVAVEAELSQRQAELDSLTSQRAYLADQVAMSTVTITLTPRTVVADVDTPGFWSGLQTGVSAFVSLIGFAITALGFLIPFLLVAAIIAVPVTIVLVRRSRRPRSVQTWHVDGAAGSASPGDASSSPSSSSSPSPS